LISAVTLHAEYLFRVPILPTSRTIRPYFQGELSTSYLVNPTLAAVTRARAKSSYELDADHPYIYPWQPLEKKGGEGKMSRDFVYGALTLLLAAWLIAALIFVQGQFSV